MERLFGQKEEISPPGGGVRVLFMAKQTVSSVQALTYLCKKGVHVLYAVVRETDSELIEICRKNKIETIDEDNLILKLQKNNQKVDYLLSFYWKKVKKPLLEIPEKGCINFHPGPLPEARGSAYHIAILKQWGYWGVTAHYMDEEFDTGKIIKVVKFCLPDNIVNRELVHLTHIKLAQLFQEVVDEMTGGQLPEPYEQGAGDYYSLAMVEQDKQINPDETPADIDRKIRAFWNPPYSGAIINISGKNYTVINEEILDYIAQTTSGWLIKET